MELSRQEYWSGLPFTSQGIFPTQGWKPGLPYCEQILYKMSHQGKVHLKAIQEKMQSKPCSWPSQLMLGVMNPPAKAGDVKRCMFYPWVRKIPWRRQWQPTPVFLPGESCGQRSLVGYSPWSLKESGTTEATWHACKHWSYKAGSQERIMALSVFTAAVTNYHKFRI